jgi:6-phosphogluconolactonase
LRSKTIGLSRSRQLRAGDGSAPADMALSPGGHVLFAESGGSHTIASFLIGANGRLIPLSSVSGLPSGAAGLAAR